jgi:anti-sigma factor RsiW
MIIGTHPVAPEQVMAFLDGELSAAELHVVSTHVENCAECANLAAQLRSTSESLSAWRVPEIPAELENSITESVAAVNLGRKIPRAGLWVRLNLWTWKQYAMVCGALAVALLVSTIYWPMLRRSETVAMPATFYRGKQHTQEPGSAIGSAGKLEVDRPLTDRSKVPPSAVVTQTTPGIAADSNGLFHGLGDHAENSFSLDGQPLNDQQSKPMIAHVVSLSVVVKDFSASRLSLDTIVARRHGYAAQLNVSTPEDAARSLQASLRIPAPELSAAVSDLKTLGRVESESQSGEEVTHQHEDLVARLKNARSTEERFRSILEQRTGNVVEVLQVEEGIARVRGEIERMEAEQKALEHRVDFASIELQITEEYKAQLNPPAPAVSTRAHNALVAGYQNAWETVFGTALFVAEYLPAVLIWLAILALPVILLWRRYRTRLAAG